MSNRAGPVFICARADYAGSLWLALMRADGRSHAIILSLVLVYLSDVMRNPLRTTGLGYRLF